MTLTVYLKSLKACAWPCRRVWRVPTVSKLWTCVARVGAKVRYKMIKR